MGEVLGDRAVSAVSDVLELVRAPAALTVLGDTMVGAHAAALPFGPRRWLLPVASVFLYSGGMAMNDYADRALDALERPERPIPSGRISPRQALAVAGGCLVAGLGLAAAGGGRRALTVAVPLAGAICLYNLAAKSTAAGPLSMAACRGLDVLLGAGGAYAALPSAGLIALHTAGITAQSSGEVHGGTTWAARVSIGVTVLTALGAALVGGISTAATGRSAAAGRRSGTMAAVGGTIGAAAYLAATLPSQLTTLAEPSAANVRTATRAGIGAMIPLQAALVARTGALAPAAALAVVDQARRALSARRTAGDLT
ncbi:UbiA family prenyltransferase [Leifsonia kafniensis]|uniref:UbiA family prenyltransferase n=1 Tax=Leifsonia kafniensis TaxID=475957 RepID=A0ABP7KRI3_9MICO